MKKKILSALLLVAFAFAATSTVTSCKDYDDEINDLKTLIQADKAALEQAKTDLTNQINALSAQLADAQGKITALQNEAATHATKTELKNAVDELNGKISDEETARKNEIQRLEGLIAGLETRLGNAEGALAELNRIIGGELEGKTYKEAITDLYGQMESVKTGLGNALQAIDELKTGLSNEETARKAADSDLQQQITAIQSFVDNFKEIDPTLEERLSSIKSQLQELRTSIGNNASAIAEIKGKMKEMSDKINEAFDCINVLNVLVQQRLRSLVFIPDAYYWGVEATSFNYLEAFQYTLAETAYDKKEVRGYKFGGDLYDDKVSDEALMQAGARTDHKDGRYDSTQYTSVMDLWANYHLNPSDVIVEDFNDVQVIDADKPYVLTRASEAQITTKKDKDGKSIYKVKDGILSVQLDVKNPDKIKSVLKGLQSIIMPDQGAEASTEQPMITIFATQVALQGDNAKEDTLITSDYATLYADIYSNVRLSHKKLADGIPFTGVENVHCGYCPLVKGEDSLHLMATVHEAAYFAPQDTCNYDATLDLRKLVETHWDNISGQHEVVSAEKMEEYGLTYKFELTGLYIGDNTTSESAHAAINPEDGYTFRPQMVEQGTGKQQAYGAEQGLQTVGRTPVVRVSLLDKYGKVLDYGYIRIKITREIQGPGPETYLEVPYDGNDKTFNDACPFKPEAYSVYKTTWYVTEYDLYKLVNMAREDFEAVYKDIPVSSNGKYTQYIKKNGKWEEATGDEIIGELSYVEDLTGDIETQSSTLEYIIDEASVKKLYDAWTPKTEKKVIPIERAYKYEPQVAGYQDIYVVFKTDITFKPMPTWSATIDWTGKKIAKYWYVSNTNQMGTDEVHTNVPAVEDALRADADSLTNLFSNEFLNNDVITNAMVTVTGKDIDGNTLTGNAADWKYTLVFDQKNVGKKFMGNDNKEYVLGVTNNGKTLTAKTGSMLPQPIAELVLTNPSKAGQVDEADYTMVKYLHGTAAEALLNYCSHKEFNGEASPEGDKDVEKDLIAIIGVVGASECQTLAMSNNTFDVRFLRPIDVINKNAEIEDASTEGKQIINLLDLVEFKDWRDAWKGANPGGSYYTYYGIKGVYVGDANGKLADGDYLSSNENVLCDLNNDGFKQLSTISTQLDFTYHTANGGQLEYNNLSSTVQEFELKIPIRIEYIWGNLYSTATVKVKRTHHNAKQN